MSQHGKPVTAFRKSTYSGAANSACVEIAYAVAEVLVRDSKNPEGPVLRFTPDEWGAFLAGVHAGEFGLI